MAENMFCENQKVPNNNYRNNYDLIFGCGVDVETQDAAILMKNGGVMAWVRPEDVKKRRRQGWERVK